MHRAPRRIERQMIAEMRDGATGRGETGGLGDWETGHGAARLLPER